MDKAGITLNKNMVPFDEASANRTSGMRIGTPAVTTRGMRESEMKVIGEAIARVIDNYKDTSALKKVKAEVKELANSFPLYPDLGVLE